MSYLEREILKNQSLIYRALLKNGYSNFRLEILEYCDPKLVLEREQYYLNTLNLEYNILKTAGSLKGFKHSEATIEQIRKIKKESNRKQPEEERIRQVSSLLKGESTIVINRVTGESTSFISGREAAVFIGINQSALAKYISKQDFYLGRGFFVYKSFSNLEGIYASEAYKKAISGIISDDGMSSALTIADVGGKKYKHSEAAKELIRQANTGYKSKQAKSVILTSIKTKEEILEFPSLKSAGEFLGVSADTVRRSILGNKPCKEYNLT
jgi:hypothetical protein